MMRHARFELTSYGWKPQMLDQAIPMALCAIRESNPCVEVGNLA